MSFKIEWLDRMIDAVNPYDPEKLRRKEGLQPLAVEESNVKKKAAKYFMVAFVIFSAWAFLAPIDAGVSVRGTVVVMGKRKAIQHPTGGVIQEIRVREGARVKQGDILVRINPLNSESDLNATELDHINALAVESRLLAERQDRSAIAWLQELERYGDDARVNEAKQLQVQLFGSRRSEFLQQQRILGEQLSSLHAQDGELMHMLAARQKQMNLISEEARNTADLAREGYVTRSRYNEIERSRADMDANIASLKSDQIKNKSTEASTRLQLVQQVASYHKDIDIQLADIQKSRKALRSQVESLRFNLALTEIRSPVAGTVVGNKVNTVGGVIQSGMVLMEIVPEEGGLIVEAEIPPALIDKVRVGLESDLRFTAFNLNTTPVIPGRVRLVGADRLPPSPPEHMEEYYLAQVETTKDGLRILADKAIQPGMSVDVIIKTGERSFMTYFLKPMTDRFARSFKED